MAGIVRRGIWPVLAAICLLGVLSPLAAFVVAGTQGDMGGEGGWRAAMTVWGSPRLGWVLVKTLAIAGATSLLAASGGWGLAFCLARLGEREVRAWSLGLASTFLVSPYVVAQGWIGWLGDHGRLWRSLGFATAPFSLYSPGGVVFVLALIHIPLAAILVHGISRHFPAKCAEAGALYGFRGWRWWRWVEWVKVRRSLGLVFLWTFALSFWAFDVPSMLRQSLYALEVVAAFGSFYDYRRALVLCLPPAAAVALLGALTLRLAPALETNVRRWRDGELVPRRRVRARLALAAMLVAGLAAPLAGLLAQLDGFVQWTAMLSMFGRDAWNTVRNGLLAAAGSLGFGLVVAGTACWSGGRAFARWCVGVQLVLVAVPGVLVGIGFVHLFNGSLLGWVTATGLQAALVQCAVVAPVIGLVLVFLHWQAVPVAWVDAARLHGLGVWQASWAITRPMLASSLVAVFVLGFTLAAREVPASLLNYPPDGSTLAISIETLLHFDQPGRVAALCLAQFAVCVAGLGPLFWVASRYEW